ncbi:MAG: NTP transferase domain-containing protein [Desulfurococcales archaeon]|nr:NTP transferase domain-containing protein [Desulfurococcales archaeon]
MASCIILAGGLSTRFPGGKLVYEVRPGKTMIETVSEALLDSRSCSEVLIVTSIHTMKSIEGLKRLVGDVDVIRDESLLPCRGPMRGITTGVLYASHHEVITTPGDALWVKPSAIDRLREYSIRLGASVSTPLWDDGFMPMLFMHIMDSRKINPMDLCIMRRAVSRPSDLFRVSSRLALIGSGLLGDDGLIFTTVNRPSDLFNPRPRIPSRRLVIMEEHNPYFTEAVRSESLGISGAALTGYLGEYRVYMGYEVRHLAIHALQDACRTAKIIGDQAAVARLSNTLASMNPQRRHGRIAC